MIAEDWVKRGIILDSTIRENLFEGIIFYHRPERNEEMNQANTGEVAFQTEVLQEVLDGNFQEQVGGQTGKATIIAHVL